ncbi:MAG: alpha-ketoglutarate-dependent dioxygenase AlkB, partial [Bosea sp. (in: a-proteobacteria)]|nr:alpha-ketoglutarate-dependent dioxygenase AlkB [Bosea sp. (in: a-proteobacteria)]
HGIDRILAGSSALLPQGGRINLTLRRVTKPPAESGA